MVAGGMLLLMCITSTLWAGQVVTESDRNWAKAAVSVEKTLGGITTPGTVAVLYFINNTDLRSLVPLQKGLSYMLITDLSKVEGLQLVERTKLQALVEEIGLGKSGVVDPDTAPRVGRLLEAEHVIGGNFYNADSENFIIKPGTLNIVDGKFTNLPDSKGLLEEIFRMEKNILFELLENLKKTPTTKAAQAELQKPMTTSLEALIFLFKAIGESDQENYQQAAAYYKLALKADPGLTAASDALKELVELGLLGRADDSQSFLRDLRDRTSLTNSLSPGEVLRREKTPGDVEQWKIIGTPAPAPLTCEAACTLRYGGTGRFAFCGGGVCYCDITNAIPCSILFPGL